MSSVSESISIIDLRKEIKRQCSPEEIPNEYIFIKSVGRAFTRVKPKQEHELKVRNFLPPQVKLHDYLEKAI
jgi:hypothetical protein